MNKQLEEYISIYKIALSELMKHEKPASASLICNDAAAIAHHSVIKIRNHSVELSKVFNERNIRESDWP